VSHYCDYDFNPCGHEACHKHRELLPCEHCKEEGVAVYKQVEYSITMLGPPEVVYAVRNSNSFWHALAEAESRGDLKVHINTTKEIQ